MDEAFVAEDSDDFIRHLAEEIDRYFPKGIFGETPYHVSEQAEEFSFTVEARPVTTLLARIEDVDFFLPLIANVAALALWLWFACA